MLVMVTMIFSRPTAVCAIASFLTEVDIGAPLAGEVHVPDSSSSGFCLMYGRKPMRAVWGAYRWRDGGGGSRQCHRRKDRRRVGSMHAA